MRSGPALVLELAITDCKASPHLLARPSRILGALCAASRGLRLPHPGHRASDARPDRPRPHLGGRTADPSAGQGDQPAGLRPRSGRTSGTTHGQRTAPLHGPGREVVSSRGSGSRGAPVPRPGPRRLSRPGAVLTRTAARPPASTSSRNPRSAESGSARCSTSSAQTQRSGSCSAASRRLARAAHP